MNTENARLPLPPFTASYTTHNTQHTTHNTTDKVTQAEDRKTSCKPTNIAPVYTKDSRWRNRLPFATGRTGISNPLTEKWKGEQQ